MANASHAAPWQDTLTTAERRSLQKEGRAIVDLLQNLNYSARQLHQIESREIVDAFITRLDPEKLFFRTTDCETLHRRFDRTLKNVYLLKGDTQPAEEMFARFRELLDERMKWVDRRLDTAIDLEMEDQVGVENHSSAAATVGAADERWMRHLKAAIINEVLAGHADAAARQEVRCAFERWRKHVAAVTPAEVRAQFWETVLRLFDPHSGYFAPEQAEEFQTMMQAAITGVGLDVEMREGRCIVAGVLPGGPADEDGNLQVGDEIIALAEGHGPWSSAGGKKLSSITATMRGNPNTILRIAYQRTEGAERREVSLTRRAVVLTEQRARGRLVHVPSSGGPLTVGLIDLPEFYSGDRPGSKSSATADVRELLAQMTGAGAKAVVMDLRANPGGALTEAVALAGLFLPSGVVSITRDNANRISELRVNEGEPAFTGPLVVLVSSQSASASEVFAGAMKFHQRAVVVGEQRTFGKGTLQSYIDLNDTSQHRSDDLRWGIVRVTSGKFYFPDGSAPQLTGAPVDIVLTDPAVEATENEATLLYALPADRIPRPDATPAAGAFARVSSALLNQLKTRSANRVETLPEFVVGRRARQTTDKSTTILPLTRRIEWQAARDEEDDEVRAALVDLVAKHGYASERVDVAAVRNLLAMHIVFAQRQHAGPIKNGHGWLSRGVFRVPDAAGCLRDVELSRFSFRRAADQASALVPLFNAASSLHTSADDLARALRHVAISECVTEAAILKSLAETAQEPGMDQERLRPGLEAILQRLFETNPWLRHAPPEADSILREALRISADWAAAAGTDSNADPLAANSQPLPSESTK